jgi:uncharacterized lipoprotein YddW (UPF0748 family)
MMTAEKSIDRVLDLAKNANLNTLFVQVRARGDAYYKSALAPRAEQLPEDGFDPLDYILKKGHARGLQIHAWLNTGVVWGSNTPPASAQHLYNLHPEWILRDATGKMAFPDPYDPKLSVVEGPYWGDWGNIEFRAHLAGVVKELVQQYPVDGVHLDFVRYPGRLGAMTPGPGYNPSSVERFRRETGADPVEYTKAWDQWRVAQVQAGIQEMRSALIATGRKIPLSAAVLSGWDLAYGRAWTDYRQALATGLLDFEVVMAYHQDSNWVWKSILNSLETADSEKIIVGLGLYIPENTPEKIAEQIRIARRYGTGGFCLFALDDVAVPKLESYMARLR